ncbi:MAG: hypothetical protein HW378_3736 [Anaerolineales bacterium]|nr:hypothetical protein [Anaerolineales bacterium]
MTASTTTHADLLASGQIGITMSEFRRLALGRTVDLLRDVADREDQRATNFVKRTPAPLERYWTTLELKIEAHNQWEAVAAKYPQLAGFLSSAAPILELLESAGSAYLLLDAYERLLALEDAALPEQAHQGADRFHITADSRHIYMAVNTSRLDQHPTLAESVERDVSHLRFMGSVCALLEDLRDAKRSPTNDESVAIALAYDLLRQGIVIPSAYQSLGVSGFRDIQTYLSLADPGDGHIKVTSRDGNLLRGLAVHVEHIDRDEEFDTELVEPYRLPAAVNAAKVRLHIGSHAPVTAFIGRPVFESRNVRRDMLKSVHMTASACTAMYRNGIADCKISIERMTATEAITFMRAVVGNVLRDRNRQFLSAAFRINYPIVDDRPETVARQGEPVTLTGRMDIARLGVKLARDGGFDKVAWDGSSNEVPSLPIMEQLSLGEWVELAHLAHEAGLECYVSAGCVARHMREATFAAIDGVGIGTSLHYIDAATKLMGALRPEAILEALQVRDDAVREPFAQCSRLLARMDRMHANAGLGEAEEHYRALLRLALRHEKLEHALQVAAGVARLQAMKPDFDIEFWSWVGDLDRTEAAKNMLGGDRLAITADSETMDEWQELVSRIEYIPHNEQARPAEGTAVG